jgi:8-oxo-dGTP pyrophosphatase MutT (NUDIX family)
VLVLRHPEREDSAIPKTSLKSRADRSLRRALAVPYRLRPKDASGAEVLLVRTRAGLWTLPGGRIDLGETPAEAAEREAHEEAGVTGRVHPDPVTTVLLIKRPTELFHPAVMHAPVFLLEVLTQEKPEESHRDPEWMSPADAEDGLRQGRMPWSSSARIRALQAGLRALG